MLLTPPFDKTPHDPGYIKGYLPGVRENGGQYTHAAIWAVLATALQGDGDRAFELFQMLNPINHAAHAAGRALQGRALRGRRRRVHRRRHTRPRRLDLVHRLGQLDVSGRAGGDPRLPEGRDDAAPGSLRPSGVDRVPDHFRYGTSRYAITASAPSPEVVRTCSSTASRSWEGTLP